MDDDAESAEKKKKSLHGLQGWTHFIKAPLSLPSQMCINVQFIRNSVQKKRKRITVNVSLQIATDNALNPFVQLPTLMHMINVSVCFTDKVEEMTHAQKTSPVDMKIATIKPRPTSRCLVTTSDMNVRNLN